MGHEQNSTLTDHRMIARARKMEHYISKVTTDPGYVRQQ